MASIIKDIINSMRQQDSDLESGAGNDAFRTRWAYFHWATRGQGFHGVMDEVAKTEDLKDVIELNNYCTSAHEDEDKDNRAALIAKLQSLNHANKHGTRVRMHFGRPNWRNVYNRVALNHRDQRVGKNPSYAYDCTARLSHFWSNIS
jgi:respiratory burst oxidase